MLDDLLAANRRHAEGFTAGGLPGTAAAGVAVVTCMDVRLDPAAALGLAPGSANVLRNAGGRVTPDVLRSLAMAAGLLGVRQVAVMHHTRCAMAGTDDGTLRGRLPNEVAAALAGWDLGAMPDPDAALAADVEAVRTSPLLPRVERVEGWRYDVDSGLVARVVSPS